MNTERSDAFNTRHKFEIDPNMVEPQSEDTHAPSAVRETIKASARSPKALEEAERFDQ